MNSILLSAGFGRRFLPHTKTLAKPAIPFLNLPLICYSLYYANLFDSKKIVVNTHHLPTTIEACIKKYDQYLKADTHLLHETPSILDSGGGIKNAQNFLEQNEYFFVFNSDIPHLFPDFSIKKALNEHINNKALATIITCDLPGLGEKVSGVWTPRNSLQIKDFGLGPEPELRCRHYTGLMILSRSIFKYQPTNKPHNILYDVILPAIQQQSEVAFCHHIENLRWFETGHLQSYLDASFKTIYDLIHTPSSKTSEELKKVTKFFGQKLFTHSDNERQMVYTDTKTLNHLPSYHGYIVSGSSAQLRNGQLITDSVITSQAKQIPQNSVSKQLIL